MLKKRLYLSLLILIVSTIVYSNSFEVPFLWDDEGLVPFNYYLRSPLSAEQYFNTSMRQRPIAVLSLLLNFNVSGLFPYGYHVTQVLLHAFVSLLLSLISYRLYPSLLFSFLSGILFAFHPLHTEAVDLLLGRSDILSLMFVLLSLYFYLLYLFGENKKTQRFYYFSSILFFLAGLFSKETAFFFPIVFLTAYSKFKKNKTHKISETLLHMIPFFSSMALYGIFWFFMVVNWSGAKNNALSLVVWGGNLFKSMLLQIEVFGRYIELLFFPFNLNVWYEVPKVINSFNIALSLFLIICFSAIFFLSKEFIIRFSFVWIIVGIIPISNLIPIPGSMMAERWTYSASAGFILAMSFLLTKMTDYFRDKKKLGKDIIIFCIVLIVLMFAITTFKRNRVYLDAEDFYIDMINKEPDSGIVVVNYGMTLVKRGENQKAINLLVKYIKSDSAKFLDQALNHLGVAYESVGKMDLAFKCYERAYQVNKESVFAITNLANQYINSNKYYEARKLLDEAVEIEPENADVNYAYGILFDRLREYKNAIEKYEISIKYNPNAADVHNNIGLDYYRFGKYDKALEELKKAITIDGSYVQAYGNLGITFMAKGDYDEAVKYFNKYLQLNPSDETAMNYLKEAKGKLKE